MFSPLLRSIFLSVLIVGSAIFVSGQDRNTPSENGPVNPPTRMELLRGLGLSPEQIRQIRELNVSIRDRRQSAQMSLRDATRELDQAIYSDQLDEAVFTSKLEKHRLAQAEVSRINFEQELAVRKILTPEQLVKFREFRRRINESREELQRRRRDQDGRQQQIRPKMRQDPQQPLSRPVKNPAPPVKRQS